MTHIKIGGIKMKKLSIILLLILTSFFLSCEKQEQTQGQNPQYVTTEEAEIALGKHLLEAYGENFHMEVYDSITIDGDDVYRWKIFPEKYVETPLTQDEYYHAIGNVTIAKSILGERIKAIGDTYGGVYCNETLNEYFRPKLEELFGKQILPIMEFSSAYLADNNHFLDSIKLIEELEDGYSIKGGIYIFGRVDNLEEKEIYREKIFQFIQYMKEKKLFEYVNLAFYILDERCLTERFDTEIGPQLIEAREELQTADEFIAYRKKLLNTLDDEFNKMLEEDIFKKINQFNRMYMRNIYKNKDNKYSVIYHKTIRSKTYLEKELRLDYLKKINYSTIEELKLLNTIKVDYKEYQREKLHNNEWDGE